MYRSASSRRTASSSFEYVVSSAESLLNTPSTLADGAAWLAAGNSNLLAGQSKDAAAINAAVNMLRSQTVNGQATDAEPALMITPSGDEATARALVRAASLDAQWMAVSGSAYLDASAWYPFASPGTWPALARATETGAGGTSLRFYPGTPNAKESTGDVILEGLHSFDVGVVSRTGVVRIEVS